MITKVTIDQFKCFDHFEIELGKFNVLIGPNDSGKTAFLQAIGIAALAVDSSVVSSQVCNTLGFEDIEPALRQGAKMSSLAISSSFDLGNISATCTLGAPGIIPGQGTHFAPKAPPPTGVGKSLGGTAYYRLNPSSLRLPSPIMAGQRSKTMTPSGNGFPTFLEEFLREDRKKFFEMEQKFHVRFPDYEIKVKKQGDKNAIVFTAKGGEDLPATAVSDGVMLYLAFLAITHVSGARLLLIEEPENGVHYAALEEIIAAIRHSCEEDQIQVAMTTHSPYLLDLVEPEEVRVFSKDKDGAVHAAKLSDLPDVQDMKKYFKSGEIWTTFDEANIVAKAGGGK